MIAELYTKYFQKSKAFIFPLTNISKKSQFLPSNTFFSWKDVYTPADHRLMGLYMVDINSEKWKAYVKDVLRKNPFFENYSYNDAEDTAVVVFNMEQRKSPYDFVLQGRYSLIDINMRSSILMYHGYKTAEWAFMETFLTPNKYTKLYSKLLNVDEDMLIEIGELCDRPDFNKENLDIFTQKTLEHLIDKACS